MVSSLSSVVPKGGHLIDNLAPKIELLIVEFFLPLYFANSGIRTNIGGLDAAIYWGAFFVVIAVGSLAKILPVTLVARLTVRLNKHGELFSMAEAAGEIAGGEDLIPALHAVEPLDEGKRMPWTQCLSLGVLMNTRGLVGLIVLNIGLSANILGEKVFTIMVLFSLVTTFITPPALYWLYQKPYHAKRALRQAEVEMVRAASLAKQLRILRASFA
jgi:Kef-type K+ transport system membrane component KefB